MNQEIYPRTKNYREFCDYFDLFFEEVGLTYGKRFCKEVKRELLQDRMRLKDPTKMEELDIFDVYHRVRARHPEIDEWMNIQTSMILGAVA